MSSTGYVIVDGCSLYYEVEGLGSAVLYFHGGFGGLGTGLAPEPPAVKEKVVRHNTFVMSHRRSAGKSDTSSGLHTLTQFSQDAEALLSHLKIDRAIVWGESAGVAIACTFALENPGRTRALILTDGAPWFSHDRDLLDRLRQRIDLLQHAGPEAAYEARRAAGTVGFQVFAADRAADRHASMSELQTRQTAKQQIKGQLATLTREDRVAKYAAELRTYSAYLDFNVTDRLTELRFPVFVAYGTADSIFPNVGWCDYLPSVPDATYFPVHGAEHGILDDQSLTEALLGFIARASSVE